MNDNRPICILTIPPVACFRKFDAARAPVKAPFADRFFRPSCCFCTCASLRTSFFARGRMGPPPFALEQRARVISRTTQSHHERSTARFPRLEYCFPANNNRDVETYVLLHCAGHNHNAWPHQTRSHESKLSWPENTVL